MALFTARPTPAGRMPRYAPGISSPWGWRTIGGAQRFHYGQDYFWLNADPAGSQLVYAAGKGTIYNTFWTNQMGNCIEIAHGNGFVSRYTHMASLAFNVRNDFGKPVTTNTFLGRMGATGTEAYGQTHLHFELWRNGVRLDPEPYFTTSADDGATPIPPTNRRKTMSTLFQKQGESLWALAGDSPGTPANWLETTGQDFANQLAVQHGKAAVLAPGTWNNWKSLYLAPLTTDAETGDINVNAEFDYDRLADALKAAMPEPGRFQFSGTATPQD